jgi:hypothetical protein
MELSVAVGLFNIFVGVMLALSIVIMIGSTILWYIRLGTYPTYRDDAIGYMQWGVAILFVDVVLLFVAQYVQRHLAVSLMAIGVLIVAGIAYFVASDVISSKHSEEEEER